MPADELQSVFEGAPLYELEFNPGNVTVLDLALKTECFDSNCKFILLVSCEF